MHLDPQAAQIPEQLERRCHLEMIDLRCRSGTSVEGTSITALAIEFGVLDSPDQRRRSHFYFRAPLPYDDVSPDAARR